MTNFPSFIITTGNFVATYSEDSGLNKLCEGQGLYYGLTWCEDNIYILRRNGNTEDTPGEVFNLDSYYREVSTLPGNFPHGHSMVYSDRKIYVTATSTNSVGIIDTVKNSVAHKNWTDYNTDVNHINSIWKDGNNFWCTYHNWTTKGDGKDYSCVVKLDSELQYIVEQIDIGRGVHNAIRVGDLLYICSSADGNLIVHDFKLDLQVANKYIGKWVRGIGITDKHIVLGVTSPAKREARTVGDSEVVVLDRYSLEVKNRIVIPYSGSIYELRVIGEEDYAHNGISFPGYKY